ncbi:MAG: TRAP transporter fused permease subunit [Alphaproteobacteria bacterium]|jgi:TRAP transporter 4TM/12TM fusion protein|nr:TRAP transporter fused permease subunit [Alphaproteobacteria bacterium]MBT5158403.1 TRAP transporter fused permease subunit [Alphaproteobacteria bacterium]
MSMMSDDTASTAWSRFDQRIEPALAVVVTLLVIFWASGLPLFMGIRVYAEQVLVAILSFASAICFLTRDFRGNKLEGRSVIVMDRLLAWAAISFGCFLAWRYPIISDEIFYRPAEALTIAIIGLIIVLEALRRAIGYSLLVVLALVCLYALFADQFTGPLQSRAIPLQRLVTFMVLDSAGMAGIALFIGATIVLPFILFSRLLLSTGGSEFFSDLSAALMGRSRGGSAKIAIVASGFFGSISGSAVSNVASTGSITIPLMKDGGYQPKTAGAIEAAASTGGQLMPPIMGASAFLLAETLQVPYREVVTAAILPALLYYLSLFVFADLEAGRVGIAPVDKSKIPSLLGTLRKGWFLLAPFGLLVVALFEYNQPPETAALIAFAFLALVSLFIMYGGGRAGWRLFMGVITQTGRASVEIALICAVAGMIIGLFSLSGLSFGLGFFLVQLGKTSVLLLLATTAVVCIILGMGMPTVGVYLLLATLAAPPLIELGIEPMAAHLFVLYFGMMSMITPPVAIAAFVAGNMAGAHPMQTGFEAVRVAWPAYFVPFIFALSPGLLMAGGWADNLMAGLGTTGGVYLATIGLVGFFVRPLALWQRLLFAVAGLSLMMPAQLFDGVNIINIVGLMVGLTLLVIEKLSVKTAKSELKSTF